MALRTTGKCPCPPARTESPIYKLKLSLKNPAKKRHILVHTGLMMHISPKWNFGVYHLANLSRRCSLTSIFVYTFLNQTNIIMANTVERKVWVVKHRGFFYLLRYSIAFRNFLSLKTVVNLLLTVIEARLLWYTLDWQSCPPNPYTPDLQQWI